MLALASPNSFSCSLNILLTTTSIGVSWLSLRGSNSSAEKKVERLKTKAEIQEEEDEMDEFNPA